MLIDSLRQAGAVDIAVIGRSDALNPPEPADDLLLPMVAYPASVLCDGEDSVGRCDLEYFGEHGIAIVDPADLQAVLGVDVAADTVRAYAEGTALATQPALVEDAQVEVGFWRTTELWQSDGVQGPSPYTQDREHAARWESLPATVIDASGAGIALMLAPATAERLAITAVPHNVISSFAEPPSARTIDAINQVGSTVAGGHFWVQIERGPDQPWPWYLLIGGIAGILVLGASAVSIGLARFDGRADDATLAAVGGNRGIRRSISFWQAIVITGVGALVGAATGLLPSWGFAEASGALQVADFPWLLIVGLAVGLPLLVALTAWLVSPRPAVLSRRTAIT